jgi:hypothetical protein
MKPHSHPKPQHPITRRTMIQAGTIGLMGLSSAGVSALRASADAPPAARPKSVIYIFLSGGLAQQDSFDLKPDAPDNIRGEFQPVATRTPGLQICEHLPRLAQRSHLWALCRSLTHPYNEHSQGHQVMLSGRTPMPPGFSPNAPRPSDYPAIASIVHQVTPQRNNLPGAAILPFTLVHRTGRVIPGQFAGEMGQRWDPWVIRSAQDCGNAIYGACPDCFRHDRVAHTHPASNIFMAPNLSLPQGLSVDRLNDRMGLLNLLDQQRQQLDRAGTVQQLDRHRQQAISLLVDRTTQQAFDVTNAPPAVLDRYGRNLFGYSCLMARRLVEAGVNMVQVNLGNNETWDTHQGAFPNFREKLFPPMDQCVSALLDDLHDCGMLDDTLVVMAGEFGRTPRIFNIPNAPLPGRDHWGAVQTVFFAGGGVRGGTVVGSSDRIGGYPATSPQTAENMAATIYQALGLPRTAAWHDPADRPHFIYQAEPIEGLM